MIQGVGREYSGCGAVRSRRAVVGFMLGMLLGIPPPASAEDANAGEIERLLGVLRASPCSFFRNGTRYSGQDAADHLKQKWQYVSRDPAVSKTGAQFIARVATASSVSGKPYLVDCGQGPQPLAAWLTAVLAAGQPP